MSWHCILMWTTITVMMMLKHYEKNSIYGSKYKKHYHRGLLCSEFRLSVFRYGVQHSVLHENADSSTDEGGEEVNVDVIASAVETPERLRTKTFRKYIIKGMNKSYGWCSFLT